MNELRPLPVWAGLARFTPAKIFILIPHLSVAKLTQKEVFFAPELFFDPSTTLYSPKPQKSSFLLVNCQKALKNSPLCTKHVQKI